MVFSNPSIVVEALNASKTAYKSNPSPISPNESDSAAKDVAPNRQNNADSTVYFKIFIAKVFSVYTLD